MVSAKLVDSCKWQAIESAVITILGLKGIKLVFFFVFIAAFETRFLAISRHYRAIGLFTENALRGKNGAK